MKLPLIALATLALAGAAVAQPPGNGPGPGRGGSFGLLAQDANGDGRLTRAEFDAAQTARFNEIDANKDGSATAVERKAFHEAKRSEMRAEVSKVRFDTLDTDKNGQISRNEFIAKADSGESPRNVSQDGRGGHHRGKQGHGDRDGRGDRDGKGDQAMRVDANSDKAVSFIEFSARGVEAFTRADTNKDGTVTIAELQAQKPGRL